MIIKNKLFQCASVFFVLLLAGCHVTDSVSSSLTSEQFPATVVYIVRHAEKVDSKTSDPPLTMMGKERAKALAHILKNESVDVLFSSDYQRTKMTLAPLAEQKNLDVQVYDASDSSQLVAKIHQLRGKVIVVAGHSNTVPGIVDLLDPQPNGREDLKHSEYDKIYVVAIYSPSQAVTLELSYPEMINAAH